MTEAIKPQDILAVYKAGSHLPDYVIEAVNELLKKKFIANRDYTHGTATLLQNDVIDAILAKAPAGITREKLFEEKYLDFESYYEQNGWKSVTYDRPAYYETYQANWVFKS